jgi:hypothetical protein
MGGGRGGEWVGVLTMLKEQSEKWVMKMVIKKLSVILLAMGGKKFGWD